MKTTLPLLALLALVLGLATGSSQAMLVKTFGHGQTPLSAVDAGKRQAMKDAIDTVHGGPGKDAAEWTPQIRSVRVMRTTKIAPAWYEAELEADVRIVTGPSSSRVRAAFLVDPDSIDNGTAASVLDDAASRLGASKALDVVDGVASPAGRLVERVRKDAGSVRTEHRQTEAADAFDLLFVVSSATAGTARSATKGDRQELRTRISVIDASTEEILSVTTVKSAGLNVPTDMHAALVRDAGRQVASLAEKLTSRQRQVSMSTRVIRIPTGAVSLPVGAVVSIFRVPDADPKKGPMPGRSAGTGEVITTGPAFIEVLADQPLNRQRRYAIRPLASGEYNGLHRGIRNGVPEVISDGDW